MSGPIVVNSPAELAAVFKRVEHERMARYDRAILSAAMIGVRVLRSVVPLDTGKLRRETRLVFYGRAFGASGVLCEIIEDTPYAAAQEAGTRPFKPSLRALHAWASRQAPNLGLDASDPRAIWAFAKAVQKSIERNGIRAKWHTRDALPKLRRVLGEMLFRSVKKGDAVLPVDAAVG